MKLAITTTGDSPSAAVDPRFGRAARFLVMDTDTNAYEVVDNSRNLNAAQGAGVQSAQIVANLGVDGIVTGHCGPKAFSLLVGAGIPVYYVEEGTVEQAVQQVLAGDLEQAQSPDSESHWV